jgi:peptidoglycan/xylan/chitin deacetylase (PgdA/CDA1 family)
MLEHIIRWLSAAASKRKHGRVLAVFNYHQVSPVFDPRYHGQHTWTQLDDFRRQVEYIKSYFSVIPLPDAIDRLSRHALRGIHAAITFDDGDISMQQHALPLLKQMGVPATFFVNTAYGRGRYYWFPVLNYLEHAPDPQVKALLTPQLKERAAKLRRTDDPPFYDATRREVEALAAHVEDAQPLLVGDDWLASLDGQQFHLGAHGHEHQRYSMMSPDWQAENLRRNADLLRQHRAYRPIFALPFGRHYDWDTTALRVAIDQGHTLLTADGGINLHRDAHVLRIPADGRDAKKLFASEMAGW